MPRTRVLPVEKIDFTTKEEGVALLGDANQRTVDIGAYLESVELELDDVSRAEDENDDDGGDDDEEDPDDAETVAAHMSKWQKRKEKYKKYADRGKVEKLQRANARQVAKVQKAKDAGKPQVYIDYKQGKADFTKNLIKTAQLIANLKKAGFLS